LWGDLPGDVVSAGIEMAPRQPAKLSTPYLLYCGRIDPNKGCRELFDYFIRFKSEFPSQLRLILAGKNDLPIPSHPDIEFRGFVSMEAMAQQTPVLASSRSEVLVDHLTQSGGGKLYNDYKSFAAKLGEMLSDNGKLQEMGSKGRDHVVSRYQTERIHESLVSVIENDMGTERRDHVVSRYQAERIHGSLRIGSAVKHELHRQTRERVRWSSSEFRRRFDENLKQCEWLPHPDYSCFTQYDQEYYLKRKEDFLHKYRCMYAVSKTISPSRILEMGTLAGSAADAYISASPTAEYVGLDIFGKNVRHNDQTP
jgi:hypothetical protein